jgi:hypothetical protein
MLGPHVERYFFLDYFFRIGRRHIFTMNSEFQNPKLKSGE